MPGLRGGWRPPWGCGAAREGPGLLRNPFIVMALLSPGNCNGIVQPRSSISFSASTPSRRGKPKPTMATQTMPLSSAQIDFVRDVATTLALNPADEWAEMVFRGVATLTYECRDQSSAESGPKQPATTGLSRDSRHHGAGLRRHPEKELGLDFLLMPACKSARICTLLFWEVGPIPFLSLLSSHSIIDYSAH